MFVCRNNDAWGRINKSLQLVEKKRIKCLFDIYFFSNFNYRLSYSLNQLYMRADKTPETGDINFTNRDFIAGINLFPAILDTLEEALFLFDDKFKIVWYNKTCNELYQYVSGKPIDSNFDFNELLTKEQQPLFYDHLNKVLTGEEAHFEWKYNQSITKWLSVSLYPFTAGNGKFMGICGSLRDITEKKINELVLLRNTAVLNNISDAVIYTDLEQRVIYFNKSAEKIYGIAWHEITGRLLTDVILYEYMDDTKENAMQVIGKKGNWEGKIVYTRRDGKKVYMLSAVTRLTDKNESTVGLIATNKDITEEEQNRQQSLQHQDNINGIINNIKEGVLLIDSDFTILTYNQRAYNLEKKIGTILRAGENLADLLPECRKKPVLQYLDLTLKDKPVEYEVLYPGNTWLLIYFVPVKNKKGDIKQICITYRDITERKESEERIRAKEKKYRTLVNSLSAGVILQTLDNKILTVNKSAELILGVTTNELKQKGFPSPCQAIIDENEKEISHEQLFFHKNGKISYVKNKVIGLQKREGIQWLRLNSAGFSNSRDTENDAVVISFEDITEQKRISGEMEVLSMVAKETVNAVCILLPDGEVLWANEGLTRLTGFSPEEIIGTKSRPMFVGPDTDLNVFNRMTYQRENGLSFKEELVIYTKARKKLWVIVTGQPIRDASGKVSRYFSLVTDITEEKKVIQEMEVLSMVAKETNNSVIIFDKVSGDTLWVNEGFTRLIGYTAADIVGKNPLTVLTGPETDRAVLKYMSEQIENDLSYYFDGILIYAKDGSKRLHQITGQPIKDVNGRVTKYFAIGTDITERRRLEEERLQKEIEQQKEIARVTLQTREAERNELGLELHDNINQILGAVKLQLSYCLMDYKAGKPVVEKSLEHIQQAMEEIRNLTHEMVMPRFLECCLKDKLSKLIANYNYAQTIQLEAAAWNDEMIPLTIKETFFRVAQEQLNNIQKHACADRITIQIKNDTGTAVMTIEDNGIGFDPHQKRNGIGISNIHKRVELHNGTSRFISAPAKGCMLSVSIPLRKI